MNNRYYDPGTKRAGLVRDLFAAIAPKYDLINDLQSLGLHRIWKSRLASLAVNEEGSRILDLCCGTGDVAFAAATRGARVVGADFSEAMLQVANQRKLRSPANATSFVRADALNLPFEGNSFDSVTISYGLRNLASFEKGIAEMHRVTCPGGRVLILDFATPEIPGFRQLYLFYLKAFVPALGKLVAGNGEAYAYILESLKNYPPIPEISRLLAVQGFKNVRGKGILGGVMSLHEATKPGP